MTSTITAGITTFLILAGIWTTNLVVYHPQTDGLDPTSPVTVMTVAWK